MPRLASPLPLNQRSDTAQFRSGKLLNMKFTVIRNAYFEQSKLTALIGESGHEFLEAVTIFSFPFKKSVSVKTPLLQRKESSILVSAK